MPATKVTITNETGGDVNLPVEGVLADTASTELAVSVLLSDEDYQKTVAGLISSGLKVNFNGVDLTEQQVLDFALTVSRVGKLSSDPELSYVDGAVLAAGGDAKVFGSNLLNGQTPDALTIGSGIDQLDFELLTPGDSGQTLEFVDTGSISVAFDGTKWTIGFDAGVSTADAVATFVNADAIAKGKIMCTSGGVGTATPPTAETPLTGGSGDFDDNVLSVGGIVALPKSGAGTPTVPLATWTDTSIEMTHGALTGMAASDMAKIRVKSNGISDAIDAVLS